MEFHVVVFEPAAQLHVTCGQKSVYSKMAHMFFWGAQMVGAISKLRWSTCHFQRAFVLYHRAVDGSEVLRHLGCIKPCTL